MFMYGVTSRLYAQYSVIATDAADQKLEQVRSAGFNSITTSNFPSPFRSRVSRRGRGP
jgi:hypothetical protein